MLRTLIVVAAACAVVYTISYCCTLPSRRAQELLILLGSVTSGGASSEVGQVLLDDVMAHKTELRLLHPDSGRRQTPRDARLLHTDILGGDTPPIVFS